MDINNTLNSDKIEETIGKLSIRINERFPNSSLAKTCDDFHKFTEDSRPLIALIDRPNILIRLVAWTSILLVVGLVVYSLTVIDFRVASTLSEIVTVVEASLNNIVLLGAGIFFLYTLENRWKRISAIDYLNQVRGFAHVIDMHQLKKDPQTLSSDQVNTVNSPKRELSAYEMKRYLDYCAEFLSLVGKVAALFSQSFPDEVIVQSSTEIEGLCSNMANKVWQKLNILNTIQ